MYVTSRTMLKLRPSTTLTDSAGSRPEGWPPTVPTSAYCMARMVSISSVAIWLISERVSDASTRVAVVREELRKEDETDDHHNAGYEDLDQGETTLAWAPTAFDLG